MPVMQLVERPGPTGFVLDVVDAPPPAYGSAPRSATPDDQAFPLSAGSEQLLDLAVLAPAVGLRTMEVHLADRSGRPASDHGHELEGHLLTLVRNHNLPEATSLLSNTNQYHVDRVTFEDPETHSVVSCSRRGVISVQGPAVEHTARFVDALLAGFRRVLGFES